MEMTPSIEDDFREVMARQLEMTNTTWQMLVRRGLDPTSKVRLDFTYLASDESDARALETFLREETDYDVRVASDLVGRRWVRGTTQSTQIDLEILRDWVEWMVLAGAENGRCVFDGWGTEIP